MKRTRLRRQSAKAKARNEIRFELLDQWLAESINDPENFTGVPLCEVVWDRNCFGMATDGHEKKLRSHGGSILDRENVVLTCRHCHRMIHENITEARERGLYLSA